MFPACYFRQRTYVAQGHMNGVPNETHTHLCRFVISPLYNKKKTIIYIWPMSSISYNSNRLWIIFNT